MHSFEVHSNESACRKSGRLGMEKVYYKTRIGGGEEGCEWRLGVIVNKIEISNPIIILINYIDTPPNNLSNNMLAIAESGTNIHIAKKTTPTMAPVIMSNDMKARLPAGSTMYSSYIATL